MDKYAVKQLSINLLPLTSTTFRLDDDLYMTDNMAEVNAGNSFSSSSFMFDMPVKLEQCVILFCKRGHISIVVNQKELSVGGNSIFLAMSGSIIEKVEVDEATEIILLVFDLNTMPDIIEGRVSSEFLAAGNRLHEAVLILEKKDMDNFVMFYKAVRNMLVNEEDKSRQVNILNGCAYIVMNILGGLMKGLDNEKTAKGSRYQQITSSFISDVHKFVLEERNIGFYAQRASLSQKHFSKVIINQTGKRPVDHIRDYLAIEAKCLLSTGRYSIKQIAEMLNFSSTSSFTRFFKSVIGKTPQLYISENNGMFKV